jgi:uncharacterized hydrophobic protein (TIGR00341 family)
MKIIEIIADESYLQAINSVSEREEVADHWEGPPGEDGRRVIRMLVEPEKRQDTLDALQAILGNSENIRIHMSPVEVILPRKNNGDEKEIEKAKAKAKKESVQTTREEIYSSVEKNAHLDKNYLVMIFLSTVVVAIGLLKNNVAVVIGAMVIAPLLGPNIALGLATALGDTVLMWKSLKTTFVGVIMTLILSIGIGIVWPDNLDSPELLARTVVGIDSAVLAMASGAAAVLALTTGVGSVLVGVMVAVALLPPTATLGIMIGAAKYDLALGAGFLLAINVVCLNLSANIAFLLCGVTPRTWIEKQKARQSVMAYIIFWIISLTILLMAIYFPEKITFLN